MRLSLNFVTDNYVSFQVNNIILTYNICREDSILKTLDISTQDFNSLEQNHKKNFIEAKLKLKINDKKLPLTTDLSKWGDIKITKGNYPYKFNNKETIMLISNITGKTSNSLNYIVSIKGVISNNRRIILQRVSVTDQKFKNIFLNFMDISYDTNNPTSFVRVINDTLFVYNNSIKNWL